MINENAPHVERSRPGWQAWPLEMGALLALTLIANRIFPPANGPGAPFLGLTIAILVWARGLVNRLFRSRVMPLFPAMTPIGILWVAGALCRLAWGLLQLQLKLSSPGPSAFEGWLSIIFLAIVVSVVVALGVAVDALVRWLVAARILAWCGRAAAFAAPAVLAVLVVASLTRPSARPTIDQYLSEMDPAGEVWQIEGNWLGDSVGLPPPPQERRETIGDFTVVRVCDERGDCRIGLFDGVSSGAVPASAPVVRWSAALRLFRDKRAGALLVISGPPTNYFFRADDAGAREGDYDRRLWFRGSSDGYVPFERTPHDLARVVSPPREWIASGIAGLALACVALVRRRIAARRRLVAAGDPEAGAEAARLDGEVALLASLSGAPLLASALAALIL